MNLFYMLFGIVFVIFWILFAIAKFSANNDYDPEIEKLFKHPHHRKKTKVKRAINKKKHTFKISKNFRVKRRSKKNLKLSRIQKNQLIGGGILQRYLDAAEDTQIELAKKNAAAQRAQRKIKTVPQLNADLQRRLEENAGREDVNKRREEQRRAAVRAHGRSLGPASHPVSHHYFRNNMRQQRLANEERTKPAREAAKAAAEKAFNEAERKKTDWIDVEQAANDAANAYLGDGDEGDGVDEDLADNRRAYIAVYIDTYMSALEALKQKTIEMTVDVEGNEMLRIGGKRKRRRTRRKKIKQEKEHYD